MDKITSSLLKQFCELNEYKKVRFFLLMIFRHLIQTDKLNLANIQDSKKARDYCAPILNILSNEDKTADYLLKTIAIWDQANIDLNNKEILKMASTTDKIKNILDH